ncbi:MAG: universal stress protein [Betaproteobacteria bacterium]
MYKHLLIPTDGSKLSDKAVTHALGLAEALGARVTVLHVSPDYPQPIYMEGIALNPMSRRDYAKSTTEESKKVFARVAKKAAAAGVASTMVHMIAETPWEAIMATAKKRKCDVIVMASHGRRGLAAMLLGSETTKVLTHSKVPVLVVR